MALDNMAAVAQGGGTPGWLRPLLLSFRLCLFFVYLLFGLLVACLIGAYFVQHKPWQTPIIRWYCVGLCRLLRVRITCSGKPPEGAALVVSNHISWLDIPVLFACLKDLSFLSKAEVRQWPLIGILAVAVGTLFIRRGGGEANAKTQQIARQLKLGRRVVVFPEGTTTIGERVLPFHPKLFGSALISNAPVQPVMLHYQTRSGGPSIAPFVGDDDFKEHLCRVLLGKPIDVSLRWLQPIEPHAPLLPTTGDGAPFNAARRELAGRAHAEVSSALSQARETRNV
jgi:lyso-ornithine lipid O-acyltransferase